jgi:hypothetical protein
MLWAAVGPPTVWVRPLGREELRSAGFTVVETAAEFERAAAGARVLWVQRDAFPLVDRTWLSEQYDAGVTVGVLDGTMVDLGDLLWTTFGGNGWITPGGWRPVASSAHRRCGSAIGGGRSSEWLYLAWIVAISRNAPEARCS